MDDWKLCYISRNKAYFSTMDPKDVWGDDWNDAPYQHNAGRPYMDTGGFKIVTFDDVGYTPAENNRMISVEQINKGQYPWLTENFAMKGFGDSKGHELYAGASLAEFRAFVERCGGEIYIPISEAEFRVRLAVLGIHTMVMKRAKYYDTKVRNMLEGTPIMVGEYRDASGKRSEAEDIADEIFEEYIRSEDEE